jgi:hypothetical protein
MNNSVRVNGFLYSQDGSGTRDMQNGGHQRWLLPMLHDAKLVVEAFMAGLIAPRLEAETPSSGATLIATAALGGYLLELAAPIAALNIVAPPSPVDGQRFEILSSKAVDALSVTAPGGATVVGGSVFLAANAGALWRYRATDTTWRRVR